MRGRGDQQRQPVPVTCRDGEQTCRNRPFPSPWRTEPRGAGNPWPWSVCRWIDRDPRPPRPVALNAGFGVGDGRNLVHAVLLVICRTGRRLPVRTTALGVPACTPDLRLRLLRTSVVPFAVARAEVACGISIVGRSCHPRSTVCLCRMRRSAARGDHPSSPRPPPGPAPEPLPRALRAALRPCRTLRNRLGDSPGAVAPLASPPVTGRLAG